MEPRLEETQSPQVLSASGSVRRRNNDPNSPEFEFWMVRNPSFPQPYLPSADELIVDGVLLPLDLVPHHISEAPDSESDPKPNAVEPGPDPEVSQPGPGPESAAVSSASKRWKDIFKMGEKKTSVPEVKEKRKEKEKKKDRKSSSSISGSSNGAELNINIWPFSRSWSAGTGRNSSKSMTRKVSSAPCSRSNSAGESKSRKWPNSPSRGGGIHLGRHSPVWQVKRGGSGLRNTDPPPVRNVEKSEVRRSKSEGQPVGATSKSSRSLNLNVPMCIGYRQQLSCRRDENVLLGGVSTATAAAGGDSVESGVAGSNSNNNSVHGGGALGGNKLFYLRTLFTKKVY